jgi:hypothetical protein
MITVPCMLISNYYRCFGSNISNSLMLRLVFNPWMYTSTISGTISPQSRRLCVYHMQLGISVALPRLSTAHSRWDSISYLVSGLTSCGSIQTSSNRDALLPSGRSTVTSPLQSNKLLQRSHGRVREPGQALNNCTRRSVDRHLSLRHS